MPRGGRAAPQSRGGAEASVGAAGCSPHTSPAPALARPHAPSCAQPLPKRAGCGEGVARMQTPSSLLSWGRGSQGAGDGAPGLLLLLCRAEPRSSRGEKAAPRAWDSHGWGAQALSQLWGNVSPSQPSVAPTTPAARKPCVASSLQAPTGPACPGPPNPAPPPSGCPIPVADPPPPGSPPLGAQ